MTTSVSRRIESAIDDYRAGNLESSLIHLVPAIDVTAKRRRNTNNVGKRFRGFFADYEKILWAITTKNVFVDCIIGDLTLPQVLYKYLRTTISHEGELDARLSIGEIQGMEVGDTWKMPESLIPALILSVVIAPGNKNERIKDGVMFPLIDRKYDINQLWGAEDFVKSLLNAAFKRTDLF